VGAEKSQSRHDLTLSTVHSAKGLEWPRVYIISAVEGRFPSAYAKASETEEELRLMYVAVTRAKDRLIITMPLNFHSYGPIRGGPSRFLAKINHDLVEIVDDSLDEYFEPAFEEVDQVIFSDFDLPKRPIANPRAGRAQGLRRKRGQGESLAESLSFGDDDGSQINDFFDSDDGSQIFDDPPEARPAPKPKAFIVPRDQESFELEANQRVNHPVFGTGLVLAISGGTATIDFDQFGKKKIMIRYSKLTVP
jgi:hypothetical protein